MPALTFAADSGTDQLAITAHGLLTGDGPATPRNVGGALPAGLTALVDVWIIRVDADHVKLATSSANALAGTAIDLTTNGTGTNILEIGVPYRRPRTYAIGVQLKSDDLNANFDAWKALWALTTGQTETVWNGLVTLAGLITANAGVTCAANQHVMVSGTGEFKHGDKPLVIPASAAAAPSGSGATLATGGFRWLAANLGDKVSYPISLPVGKRILSVDIAFTRAGGTLTFDLRKASVPAGVVASISSTTVSSGTSSTTATLSPVNYDVVATEQYQLEFTAGATNDDVRAVVVHVGSTP